MDKRVRPLTKEQQDRLLHTLPVWARERIAALEAENARLTAEDAYNTDIIARFEAMLTAAEAEVARLKDAKLNAPAAP